MSEQVVSRHRFGGGTRPGLFPAGEMGERIAALDWMNTAVGPVENWPPALMTALRIMLGSRYPMFVWWGRDLINFYNDAYIPVLGNRHPWALGLPAREIWREIWHDVGPQAEFVANTGQATWNERLLLVMERYGYTEETYFTFSYSPVPKDDGSIGGVYCACSEETERVLGERRLRTLRQLAAKPMEARSAEQACKLAVSALSENPSDVPFALVYLLHPTVDAARLAATAGIDAGSEMAPTQIASAHAHPLWRFDQALAGKAQEIGGLGEWGLTGGPWPETVKTAMVLPLLRGGQERPAGFVILASSPRLQFEDRYRGFFDLVAGSLASAIAKSGAFEEERRRADELAELDRAKTQFFSNVSHEFRTPLTLMLGPLEDMLGSGDGLPDEQRSELRVVHRNGLRLLRLVNSLLDFSRIEGGRIKATYSAADLRSVTEELASSFQSLMERAGLDFRVDCKPLPEPVWVDQEMWEKVVLNLLSNAFKFTYNGAVTVDLQAVRDHVELRVSDTGAGIPPDELPRVFERFHRVEGVKGRTFEGSGIGLALVQELVRLHGGSIRAESAVGRGSTFTVSVPFGHAHLPADRLNQSPSSGTTAIVAEAFVEEAERWLEPRSEPITGERQEFLLHETADAVIGSRILVVDDNPDMRSYIRRLLVQAGYELQTAANGDSALQMVGQQAPDLIVSDIMMPGLDGFGLLNAIRSDAATRNVPVILLSARAGDEARAEGMTAGADDYLTKPFSARELLARVGAHLRLADLRRQSEAALRESENRYRCLAEQVLDGIFVADEEGRFADANGAGCDMLGYTLEELVALCIPDVIAPEEHDRLPEQYERLASGAPVLNEWQFRRKDGSAFTGELMGRRLSDGRYQGVVRDVTERKRAEEKATRQLQRLVESNIIGIAVANEARVLDANDVYLNFLGRSRQELQSGSIRWLASAPEDSARTDLAALSELRERGVCTPYEKEYVRADGTRVPVLVGAAALPDSPELTWIGFIVDLTAQKSLERELRSSNQQLMRANQDLEQFAYSASHDLREPLRNVTIYSEILTRRYSGRLDDQADKFLQIILDGTHRMSNLITDLLEYTRSGSLTDERIEPVDAEAVLGQVRKNLAGVIEENQASVTHDTLPVVLVRPIHMQQLLQNLIGNSIKYRKDSEPPRVHVTAARQGDFWRFAVTDNGVGIAPEYHDKIFGLFKRLHSNNQKYSGTGIGLALCHRIVERYNGSIWVDSAPGVGSTFHFTLPVSGAGHE